MTKRLITSATIAMVLAILFGCAGDSSQGEDILSNTASLGKASGTSSSVGQMSLTDNLVKH